MLQHIDQHGGAGDIATTARECLGQRAHPDINPRGVNALLLENPPPSRAQHANGMRLIDHEPSIIPPGQRDEAGEVGHVPIHRVMPFDHNEGAGVALAMDGQFTFRRHPVIMGKGDALGAGKAHALGARIMQQRIMQD